jgi:hypothetical protein
MTRTDSLYKCIGCSTRFWFQTETREIKAKIVFAWSFACFASKQISKIGSNPNPKLSEVKQSKQSKTENVKSNDAKKTYLEAKL